MNRIAVISDIHSNSLALTAVVEDITRRGINEIINLGDTLYGPISPNSVFHIIKHLNITSISGNQDRLILENLDKDSGIPTLEFVKSRLDNEAIEWLRKQPFDLEYNEDIYCCHGNPINDDEYLLEQVPGENNIEFRDHQAIMELIGHITQKVILCGHSHVAKVHNVGEKIIINAGSVGLQAYTDELPYVHSMENHTPHARYMILNKQNGIYSAELSLVDYDFKSAARLADINGRNDWAKGIRTGKCKFNFS